MSKYLPSKQRSGKCYLDDLCSNIKENMEKLDVQRTDSYEMIMQKFNTSFKKVTSHQTHNSHADVFSDLHIDLHTDLQNIQSTFSTVNKTLINEGKIKNRPIPENSTVTVKPLTQAIKDNLVLIEQACNIFNENQLITN